MSLTIVRQRDLAEKLRDSRFADLWANSWSPGHVGAQLGITRQGVHELVRRGRLDAIRLVSDRMPRRLLAYVITIESVEHYRATRYQRNTA